MAVDESGEPIYAPQEVSKPVFIIWINFLRVIRQKQVFWSVHLVLSRFATRSKSRIGIAKVLFFR